ncbi:galactokinase [Frankia sp. AgB1.9]|uniref:galactokinase n=1 Tax=unclassified Frankia TaxID=2632575 RepID=UPI001934A321|nr:MULTISPECIES: galactokinase [unclassified Frankia]MBL7492983.1 galactokinase [Frankia sp. AgW1.1]MBL7549587.1 galactokinase [Frankia sp. AgB1.9]MBL7620432.1 galactokinase [Frankia sp. AgB1.8]
MTAEAPDAARRAVAAFVETFGAAPRYLVRSPGRVNLIGEHTDYNDGLCLPVAVGLELCLAFSPAEPTDEAAALIEVFSEDRDAPARVHLPPPVLSASGPPGRAARAQAGWTGYVEGVVAAMGSAAGAGASQAGADASRGWFGTLASDLPAGAGLSSSAALELAVARACAVTWRQDWDPVEAARLAHRAENHWVGAATGLLDQLACATSTAGHALRIDFRDLTTLPVAVPDSVVVAIVDTGTRRDLVTSAYGQRRAECERAAARLGVDSLRDLADRLPADAADRLDPVELRRARHIVTENTRVQEVVAALLRSDLAHAGAVLLDGHRSLRDDFEVCGPELDAAVAACRTAPGCHGARMTGGGFAGCVIALIDARSADTFTEAVLRGYRAATGRDGVVHLCRPVGGTSLIPVQEHLPRTTNDSTKESGQE